METSLHRELKSIYAGPGGDVEVRRGPYRIDAVRGDTLIEIQHSGLGKIRGKIRALLRTSRVLVVKPIIAIKRIEKLTSKDGQVASTRRSPKRGSPLALFDDLIHFATVFPHKRLTLETPLVEVAEVRYPGSGRRRWRRKNDFQVADQRLISIVKTHRYQAASDLLSLLPTELEPPFDTAELAEALEIKRHVARQVAYCLRTCGAITATGKRGNSIVYEISDAA